MWPKATLQEAARPTAYVLRVIRCTIFAKRQLLRRPPLCSPKVTQRGTADALNAKSAPRLNRATALFPYGRRPTLQEQNIGDELIGPLPLLGVGSRRSFPAAHEVGSCPLTPLPSIWLHSVVKLHNQRPAISRPLLLRADWTTQKKRIKIRVEL